MTASPLYNLSYAKSFWGRGKWKLKQFSRGLRSSLAIIGQLGHRFSARTCLSREPYGAEEYWLAWQSIQTQCDSLVLQGFVWQCLGWTVWCQSSHWGWLDARQFGTIIISLPAHFPLDILIFSLPVHWFVCWGPHLAVLIPVSVVRHHSKDVGEPFNARDWTPVSIVQGKCSPHYTITLAPSTQAWELLWISK